MANTGGNNNQQVPVPPVSGSTTENIDLLARLRGDIGLAERVNALSLRIRGVRVVQPPPETLQDGHASYEILSHLLMMSINGAAELPEQKVNVEYLRNEQRMVIPTALGMGPLANMPHRSRYLVALADRYWRATTLSYTDIRALIVPRRSNVEIRTTVDAINLVRGNGVFEDWRMPAWGEPEQGDPEGLVDMVMGSFSAACQLNCDIRDFGMLLSADMCVIDAAWINAANVPRARLRNKLFPYTIQCIAALNYDAVGRYGLSAYVRAFGLGMGIMPDHTSLTQQEWVFSVRQPTVEQFESVNAYQSNYQRPLITLSANILAMFGLFHLAKDHTFRTNDANMDRIATSFINTLRTDASSEIIDQMLAHKESVVRTGPHPFGLSQTYWLARVMSEHGLLTTPLAVRIDVTPPPIQRIMIVEATRKEWANLPAGRAVDSLFERAYPAITEAVRKIKEEPPRYSSLHKLYATPIPDTVPAEVLSAVDAMMPTVYGYIMVYHKGEKGELDGLGLALSLANVSRDRRGLTRIWTEAWEKYSNDMESAGIIEFVQMIQARAGTSG